MPAPLVFIGLPLVAAPFVYLVRGWRRADAALALIVTLLLGLLTLRLPLDEPIPLLAGFVFNSSMAVLGRAFEVQAADRLALTFIFVQAALLYVGAWLSEPGRYFPAASLAILGLLAAALFVRPFLFAALFFGLAAAMAVVTLADVTRPVTRGALRFLIFMTLAMPFVLLAGWLIEASAASPEDPSFILQATLALGVGFAILLAVAPFHGWVPSVAEHAPPLAAAFVFTVMRLPAVFLLLTLLDSFVWLGQSQTVYRALTLAGGGMVLVGALFAFGQRNLSRVLGYAMLIDFGAVLLAVGLGTRAGAQAALGTLAVRALALPLWAMGLSQLRRAAAGDDFDALRALGRRYPLAAAAVVFGLLSVVGFPLTAGFPVRWALIRLLAQIHPSAAILLWIGMGSVALVCARGLTALLTPLDETARPLNQSPAESRAAIVVYGLGLALIVVLGAFPQWLLPGVASAASVFTALSP